MATRQRRSRRSPVRRRKTLDWFWPYLALFTSLATIVCCALPLALVMLGLGASWAALISDAPWLVPLSQHKNLVFAIAGTLIVGNLTYVYLVAPRLKARAAACSIEQGPNACDVAGRVSRVTLWISAAIWLTGFSIAYLLPFAMGI
jgi:mercuric ion transport protein